MLSIFQHRIAWLQGILKGSSFTHFPFPIINIKMPHPTGRYFFRMVTSLYCSNITERNLAAIPGILFLFRELNIVKSISTQSPKLLSQNLYPATIVQRKIYHSFLFSRHACMLSGFSCVWLCAALWMVAHQAPLSMGFSRQEYWSGLPFPSPKYWVLFYPPGSLFCGWIISLLTRYGLKVSPSTWRSFYEYCLGCLNIFVNVKIKSQCNFLSLSCKILCACVHTHTHSFFCTSWWKDMLLYLVIYGHLISSEFTYL